MAKHAAVAPEKKKKAANPWRIVTIVASVVLVCALIAIGAIVFSYWQGQQQYQQLREQAGIDDVAEHGDLSDLASLTLDWDALREQNGDIVAWIIMPDTEIDYPVVQASDNSYYLNHSFDNSQNWLASYGTIFMDYANSADLSDSCNFFYGHHMNDGSMFAFLDDLTDQGTFDENRTIYVLTPQGNYRLKTFADVITVGSDMIVANTFGDDVEMDAYIADKINRSCVSVSDETKAGALAATKIFGMSTCDYSKSDGRAVLFSYVAESTVPGVTGVEQ